MDVRIGPFQASVRRHRTPRVSNQSASHEELDGLLATWSPLPRACDPEMLAAVSVSEIDSPEGQMAASTVLSEYGITVVPDFVDRQKALAAGQRALAISDEVRDSIQHDNYQVLVDSPRGYHELAGEDHATVHVRGGVDRGMLDIFNFDLLDEEIGGALLRRLSEQCLLNSIPKAKNGFWSPSNLNVYVNRSVGHTRMFHVDSYGNNQFKAFVYLTDVLTVDDGPYAYVLGSHTPGLYRDLNLALSAVKQIFEPTDAPLVNPSKILPVVASAGSLILSNQSGFHRGYPQGDGNHRALAVLNVTSHDR